MINIKTGEIQINNTIINRNFNKIQFINSDIFLENNLSKKYDIEKDNFSIGIQKIGDNLFFVELFYEKSGIIKVLRLIYTVDGNPKKWEDWSYEEEMQKKKINDELLVKELGKPPYDYDWDL